MIFLRVFEHLLPRSRTWRLTPGKVLTALFDGLQGVGVDARTFFDLIWSDLDPSQTRELDAWESQFALGNSASLTETERRDRLDAAWKTLGGQDPRYIEDTLRANGFDVYVHEWWEPSSRPAVGVQACAIPRNPNVYLAGGQSLNVQAGELSAQAGEPFAQAGNSFTPEGGYALATKLFDTEPDFITFAGEDFMEAGEDVALAGNYLGFREVLKTQPIPTDPAKWPFFLYIGAQTFGLNATVPLDRRDEFENLCLRIKPGHVWLGMLINYT